MIYDGSSIPDILNQTPGLTSEKPSDAVKVMLKFRHLSPIWGTKTQIAPEPIDNLVIKNIPDIVHVGFMHITDSSRYNGIHIVNSGTMQAQTDYQKSLNVIPTPGEVIIYNLQTLGLNKIGFK